MGTCRRLRRRYGREPSGRRTRHCRLVSVRARHVALLGWIRLDKSLRAYTLAPGPSSAKVKRRAQVLGTIGVALIVCFVLVGLVWGMSGDFLVGDSQPVVTITQSVP